MERARLVYVTDTYCIWCWGFGTNLRAFAEANRDRLRIEVVQGGLLTGDRVVPVREKKNARASTARVEELCGVEFGPGYFEALDEGSTVLDSTVSSAAHAALLRELPGQDLQIAHALQHAWYWDGADLADDAVLSRVATSLGADPGAVVAFARSDEGAAAAAAMWERRKELPVRGYPTLIMETADGWKQVGGPTSAPERLTACFDALLAGHELPEEPDDDKE